MNWLLGPITLPRYTCGNQNLVYQVVQNPTVEPVTLADAKLHLRIDNDPSNSPPDNPDDQLITRLITAARQAAEDYIQAAICMQTVEVSPHLLSGSIPLDFGKAREIESISYVDSAGMAQVVDPAIYEINNFAIPQLLQLTYQSAWPEVRNFPGSTRIRYVVGYDNVGDSPQDNPVPKAITQAILLIVGQYYDFREDVTLAPGAVSLPQGARALLQPYRKRMGV